MSYNEEERMTEQLKPCPWCGSAAVGIAHEVVDGIVCDGCGFYWSFDDYGSDAAGEVSAQWNTRPIEDGLRAMLRELEWQHEFGESYLLAGLKRCPVCDSAKQDGHAADCRLAALLRE